MVARSSWLFLQFARCELRHQPSPCCSTSDYADTGIITPNRYRTAWFHLFRASLSLFLYSELIQCAASFSEPGAAAVATQSGGADEGVIAVEDDTKIRDCAIT